MSTPAPYAPQAFTLLVGHVNIAEGVHLTSGMYLLMFMERNEIMYLNEDQMISAIEQGARLVWAGPLSHILHTPLPPSGTKFT